MVCRVPALVTLLLLSRVTIAPAVVGLIEPSAVILMSSAVVAPAAVLVAIGVVRAVVTVVSANAAKPMAKRGAAATVATRTLRCITNDTP